MSGGTKGNLSSKPQLVNFLNHCCCQRHYIKKCGESSCTICKPVHLPDHIFRGLMHLPDPIPCSDGHYKPFTEPLGKRLQKTIDHPFRRSQKKKTLPFHGVLQHIKNANNVECGAYFMRRANFQLVKEQPCSKSWINGRSPVVHSYKIST